MDFREATERAASARITLADLAKSLSVAPQTLRHARVQPGRSSYQPPPPGWETELAHLARNRAGQLLLLARELESL